LSLRNYQFTGAGGAARPPYGGQSCALAARQVGSRIADYFSKVPPTISQPVTVPPPLAATLPDSLPTLLDRERIVACLTELFLATDRRDWAAVEACFAPAVRFDMSSAGGAPPATVPAGEITAGWRSGLAGVEHLHHQVGNVVVLIAGEEARAFCYGIAYHYRARADGRNTRVFVGSYDFELARERGGQGFGWRITAMAFTLKFLDGNPALEAAE
jgi:hypothetical protein